jgi:hypothetical protein
MIKRPWIIMIIALLTQVHPLVAQHGEIRGKITDKTSGDPMIGATVSYTHEGMLKGTVTDENGEYILKPLPAGVYELTFSFVTFKPVTISEILVNSQKATYVDVAMEADNELPPVVIKYVPPIIDKGITPTMTVLDPEQIQNSPDREIANMVATTAGVYQADRGGALFIRGSRPESTQYLVDGVKVLGDLSIPNSAIAEISVITGGIPAMFGDATGGVIIITTKSYMHRNKY